MKKIISYFLAVLMFLQGTTFVHAAEIAGNSADNSLRLVQVSNVGEDLAETELQNLVSANVYEPGSLTIVTTGFTAYNADTDVVFRLLPVLVNGKYVGIVHIGRENTCSFSTNIDLLEKIERLKSDTYLLYVCDGNYYAESENECVPLVSTGFSVDGNSGFDLLTFEQKKEILLQKSDIITVRYSDTLQEAFLVNTNINSRASVPAVESDSCAISKFMKQSTTMGCWAACIATIVNYKKSSNITEEGVISASGITSGADINQTLSVLNDYSLSYKLTLSKIGWSRVKSCISADYPFIIGLESGGMGHMITGYGYSCTQGDPDSDTASRYVKAWDPVGSKISFAYYSTYVTCSGYTGQWVSTIYDN